MKKNIDIVTLIQNNPLNKFSETYQSSFINKLKESFNDDDQQLFLSSFYIYLNYEEIDFVIELDNIWKWLGFSRIDPCKRVLEKHFTKDIDYKIITKNETAELAPQVGGAKKETRGGHNKETILLNIKTFKKLCLKSNTKRADSIHDYFLKLEKILHQVITEESDELKKKFLIQEEKIKILEHKPETYGFSCRKSGFVYLIRDRKKPGHYKIGMAVDSNKRLTKLNTASSEKSLELIYEIDAYDREFFERTIHSILQPFNIRGRREWFYFNNDDEVNYAIFVMDSLVNQLQQFNIQSHQDLEQFL